MKNKTITKKILCVIAAFVLSLFAVFESVLSISPTTHKAVAEQSVTGSKYTDVLEDLSKGVNFDVNDYPVVIGNTSMKVIQIAESSDSELFLYVYQPSNTLTATKIRMCTAMNGVGDYKDYSLTLVSENGALDKYVVNNYRIGNYTYKFGTHEFRYYGFAAILRPYVGEIDGVPTGNNTTEYTAVALNQLWEAHSYSGKIEYSCEYLETITIEDRHTGYIRYLDKWFWFNACTDSHYVAFRTNRNINKLLEATVSYTWSKRVIVRNNNILYSGFDSDNTSAPQSKTVQLLESEVFEKTATQILADTYKYKRIQSASDFLSTEKEELTSETQQALKGMQYVLRFAETDYVHTQNYTTSSDSIIQNLQETTSYTIVSDVTILRLRFEYDEETYDLGAVDNVYTGSGIPDNENPETPELPDVVIPEIDFSGIEESLKEIMTVFGGVIVVAILGLLFSVFAPILGTAFKALFKGLTWLLSLPFKLLDKLFKKK